MFARYMKPIPIVNCYIRYPIMYSTISPALPFAPAGGLWFALGSKFGHHFHGENRYCVQSPYVMVNSYSSSISNVYT